MTPDTPTPGRPLRRIAAVLTIGVVAGLGIGLAPAAYAADGPCAGDDCDQGAWRLARGLLNDTSYWGMFAGHNCTNYVAWRMTLAGVLPPRTGPGDAAQWADAAANDGYLVDHSPTVGAVAQWDSFAGGNGIDGHVAVVEKVNDDGTILISEDYWHGGDQLGPLTYRLIPASSPSHFIHYLADNDFLRTASLSRNTWVATQTGVDIQPTAMSGVTLADRAPEFFYVDEGSLWEATQGDAGWTRMNTGVRSNASSLSVVTMNGTRPYVMSIDDGGLMMSVRAEVGWQRMSTGFAVTGDVSAVNLGGLFPTVYLSQGGSLWRLWGDMDGWHSEPTGVEVWGRISAIVDDLGRPVVFNAHNGILFRSWQDDSGWHQESTGILATGMISAVQTAPGAEVFLVEDDVVYRIQEADGSWTKTPTDLDGGTMLSVLDQGTAAPLVVLAG